MACRSKTKMSKVAIWPGWAFVTFLILATAALFFVWDKYLKDLIANATSGSSNGGSPPPPPADEEQCQLLTKYVWVFHTCHVLFDFNFFSIKMLFSVQNLIRFYQSGEVAQLLIKLNLNLNNIVQAVVTLTIYTFYLRVLRKLRNVYYSK